MSPVPSSSELSTPNFHSFVPLIHHTINKAGMCSEQGKYLNFSPHILSTSSFAQSVCRLLPVHALNSSDHNRHSLKCKEEMQLTKEIQSRELLTADGSSGQILLQTEENPTTMTRTQIKLKLGLSGQKSVWFSWHTCLKILCFLKLTIYQCLYYYFLSSKKYLNCHPI